MDRHFIYYISTIDLLINSINKNVVNKIWSVLSYNSYRSQETGSEKTGVH